MVVLVLALLLVAPAGARAATRYAATDGSSKSPVCAADAPCTLARAVNDAAAGDEVVVGPGEYKVTATLKPREDIELHGDRDHAAPRLMTMSSLGDGLILLKSGTLGHLALEAHAGTGPALKLKSGTVDGIRVVSTSGDGVVVDGSGAGTLLRNSVVRAANTAIRLKNDGDMTLRSLTVMAPGAGGVAIEADVHDTASLVNVIAHGGDSDVVADDGTVTAAFSNFRPDRSPGVSAGAGNQSGEPLFADDDYRPAPGSPTIDAGALDAFSTSPDPDGHPRSLGAAPDIGAYEFVPVVAAGGGGDTQTETQMPDDVLGVPVPKQGVSVVVGATSGAVRIRRPGSDRFEALDEAARVPVGSVLDARRGRVRLVSAVGSDGAVQSGVFWGTSFRATQRRRGGGMTTLTLRGPELRGCSRHVAHAGAIAVTSRKHRRHRRSLWGSDNHGRFRTHGHDSVATARGTRWLTRETCRGTLTRVRDGAVMVRDLRRHRRVLVTAGHSYMARRHP